MSCHEWLGPIAPTINVDRPSPPQQSLRHSRGCPRPKCTQQTTMVPDKYLYAYHCRCLIYSTNGYPHSARPPFCWTPGPEPWFERTHLLLSMGVASPCARPHPRASFIYVLGGEPTAHICVEVIALGTDKGRLYRPLHLYSEHDVVTHAQHGSGMAPRLHSQHTTQQGHETRSQRDRPSPPTKSFPAKSP